MTDRDDDGIRHCIICGAQVDVGLGSFLSRYRRMGAHVRTHDTLSLYQTLATHSPGTALVLVLWATAIFVTFTCLTWWLTR